MKQLTKHEKREMVEAILDDFDFDLVFKALQNVEIPYKPPIIQLVRMANQLLYSVLDYAELCKAKGEGQKRYIKKNGYMEAIYDDSGLLLRFILTDTKYATNYK